MIYAIPVLGVAPVPEGRHGVPERPSEDRDDVNDAIGMSNKVQPGGGGPGRRQRRCGHLSELMSVADGELSEMPLSSARGRMLAACMPGALLRLPVRGLGAWRHDAMAVLSAVS